MGAYLGEYIKNMRKRKSLSQKEVASAAGFSQPFLSDIENGNKYPTIENFKGLIQALDMTPDDVLEICFRK